MPIPLFLGTAAGTSQAARWKAGSQPCSTQGPDSLWRRTDVTAFLLGNDVGGPWPCITRGRSVSTHFYPCGTHHRASHSLQTITGCASVISEITTALLQIPAKNSSSGTLGQVPPYPHGRLGAIFWHLSV